MTEEEKKQKQKQLAILELAMKIKQHERRDQESKSKFGIPPNSDVAKNDFKSEATYYYESANENPLKAF